MGQAKIRKLKGDYGHQKKIDCRYVIGGVMPDESIPEDVKKPGVTYMAILYQLIYNHKKIYCCVAGGQRNGDDFYFTSVGSGTVTALLSLPIKYTLRIIQEVTEGPTPLFDKIKATLDVLPDGSAVVFLGDAQNYLDGEWVKILNIKGKVTIDELKKESRSDHVEIDPKLFMKENNLDGFVIETDV
ncbi:hypothetical protein [Acidithiobacillus sulfurivorans]|uniref:Uncharacterized protein n=1 Tax=Acidithiobacillus sulfurivorans TaxID=1958756 RepID=A0ABS6A0R0_9PROT|nr:hypothetical protein [Acidithiobacillus sulfurivorans]MBU2761078.1 hypothetical protein [Acidithiobacillus sulfurivorans]